MRPLSLGAALVASALLAVGCSGDTEQHETDAGTSTGGAATPERLDSIERFSANKRAIAETIEAYEASVRAGDPGALCRRVLDTGRDPGDRARIRRCVRDQDNDALRRSTEAREQLDLVVRRIDLVPRRPPEVRGIPDAVPRYQIEWGLEDAPRAVALVRSANRGAPGPAAFGLTRYGGEWRIMRRWRARETEPARRASRACRVLPAPRGAGLLRDCGGERLQCPGGREAGISHGILAPPRASGVRDAAMHSDIGPELRRALRDGAALHLSAVDYRELKRGFSLRLPSGRTVVSFPVYGPGPRYVTADIWGCPGWIERITHVGIPRSRRG